MNHAPHPFSLRQLQYAVAVADALSFRKAAQLCHVSQPSLSSQLAQLELALGVRLFERDRRRVLATAAGKELIERARRLLVDADDLGAAARRASDPLDGTLRLGVIPTVSPYLLPHVTPALRADFPKLTAVWIEDKTDALVRGLETGALDAALLALEAELGEVEHEVVSTDPFMLATAQDDPLGQSSALVERTELRDADVLLLDDGHCFREQALAYCSRTKARELEFRATSLATLTQMVASGLGVTLLPALAVPTEAERAGLSVRPFAEPAPARTLALVWRRRSPIAAALRRVAVTLRTAYPPATLAPRRAKRRPRRASRALA
ncbi:MAG: LysR substrate-binding domain-containing protein [Deltaproteobacteria bacterium]